MAHYKQRELLEQLMGKEFLDNLPRDYYSQNKYKSLNTLTDPTVLDSPRICKSFLVGKCPYDIFSGTKEDIGKCPKLHLEKHKILYEACKKRNIRMPNLDYELDYMWDLEAHLRDCNLKIDSAQKRLEYTEEEKAGLTDVTRNLDDMDVRIGLMMQEIDILIENDDMEKSIVESKKLADLCSEREVLSRTYADMLDNLNQSHQQKLQVCDICGAYLSRLDNDRRLADHFVGKIHLGYVEMRNALKELEEKNRTYNKESSY
ncbi:unnamed protein product [[Candida] boidinii]|nr:hypothetical protein BVG19_g1967 [[Candida] boidinii]OWB49431.1 hypothetical protein B5S27_g972 [[Candida] boidinii]GMF52165.1 unnamed protein product [[Candida] boidinii]